MTDEEEFKKIMLDPSDVSINDPQSLVRYGKRCVLAGEIWWGMKWAQKEVERLKNVDKNVHFTEKCPSERSDMEYMEQVKKAIEFKKEKDLERELEHAEWVLKNEWYGIDS